LSGGLSSNCSNAKCYYAHISETIGGSPLAVFNPNQYNAATSQTQWTSSTGEIWTINTGTATTGYKGHLCTKTIIQGDGIDDLLQNSTLARPNIMSQFLATKSHTFSPSGIPQIVDSSATNYLNAIFYNVANLYNTWTGGTNIPSTAPVVLNRLYLITCQYNPSVLNSIFVNNANEGTNTANGTSGTGIRLLSKGGGVSAFNATINTYIVNNSINTPTQRTDMYNYIRSINNSAF
jgi:hypothetical protein